MAKIDKEELDTRFTYHPPDGRQPTDYEYIRALAFDFAELIVSITPESREQSLAITKLEEAVMWANAGIARRS